MTIEQQQIRTYSHWSKPQSSGMGKLGGAGTNVMMGGLIFVLILLFINFWLALGALVVLGVALFAIIHRNADGLNLIDRGIEVMGFFNSKHKGANLYRSGPLSRIPWGTHQLPGIAAGSKLYEYRDSNMRPFALVHVPSTDHYTVVIETQPDGSALVDQEQIDAWVGAWGFWMNAKSDEPGIEAFSVTIETAPDTGHRFARQVRGSIDDDASEFSRMMLEEIVDTYPSNSATTRAYVALTFKGQPRAGSKKRTPEEVASAIANRLSGITAGLEATGAGSAVPATAQELCEYVRVAYDPQSAVLFDMAYAEGKPVDLTWDNVGPGAHEAAWDHYRHENAWSVTWTMTAAPRGQVREQVLARLLAPHPAIDRKRVTLHYRPIDAGKAATIVESDLNNATHAVTGGNKPTARKHKRLTDATRVAMDEAAGAGIISFGLSVTATSTSRDGLEDARSTVEQLLGPSARIRLRTAYGSQDAAFASTLPIGIIPFRHAKVPTSLREKL